MGLIAEHFADEKGLVWPSSVAPSTVYLVSIGDDPEVIDEADSLYDRLTKKGVDVLYDDRDVRPGEKFADADLLGIPYRVVVSKNTIKQKLFELKSRTSEDVESVSFEELIKQIAR